MGFITKNSESFLAPFRITAESMGYKKLTQMITGV
jgi:hypothetical protein